MKAKTMKLLNHINCIVLRVFISTLIIMGGFTAASFFSGCEDERESGLVRGESGYLTFSVSGHSIIQTRAATPAQEADVRNLYVFLFNADTGKKESGAFYTGGGLNRTDEGYKIKLSDVTEGNKKVVGIANIKESREDTKQRLQVTREQLDGIGTLEELERLSASIARSQQSADVEKNEIFLMCSDVTELILTAGGRTESKIIPLHRLMAKIEFRIVESPNFIPKSWDVINLPSKAYIVKPTGTVSLGESDYFQQKEGVFVGLGLGDSFIFYQQESRLEPQEKIMDKNEQGYRKRALREKSGTNPKTNGAFKNAPLNATYVVIKGSYHGPRKAGENGNIVSAEVEYTIPLGYTDPADPVNDYSIERNTHYIYKVRVQGVDDIYVEAIRNDPDKNPDHERNPGVEGEAMESQNFWEIDAHYEQRLLRLTEEQVKQLDFDNLYCIVKTPFGNETFTLEDLKREPDKYGALCEWVQFRHNSMSVKVIGRNKYYWKGTQDQLNRYPAAGVGNDPINLQQFLEQLKENRQWSIENASGRYSREKTIFSYEAPHEAFFTVYFDEYFYEKDPVTKTPVRWNKFVNGYPRELIIAIQKNTSVDQKSIYYGQSLLAVSQTPIYTPYRLLDVEDYRAVGVESVNETGFVDLPVIKSTQLSGFDWRYFYGWTNFYDYYNKNFGEWKSLHEGNYQDQRYNPNNRKYSPFDACLYRNRDLNRNGRIDVEEVRWYLPSASQLINIALGQWGMPEKSRLYQSNNNAMIQNGWYISSTPGNQNYGLNYWLWSEQGISIGTDYMQASGANSDKRKGYNIRCVRSLGQTPGANYDDKPMHTLAQKLPDTSPTVIQPGQLNGHSIAVPSAFLSEGERPQHTFKEKSVLPTDEFYMAEKNLGPYSMNEIEKQLLKGTSPCAAYSEKGIKGWRMPTMIELQLISDCFNLNDLLTSGRYFSSTWSETKDNLKCFEVIGGKRKFHIYNESDGNKEGYIRCVKDKY